jgi:hypothetical protein
LPWHHEGEEAVVELKDLLGVVAFVMSLVNFAVTLRLTKRRDVVAIRPMLVFTYREEGWHIENVGNGPALDVIFTRLGRETGAPSVIHVRLPTLAKGACSLLKFARYDESLIFVATYTDIDGRRYTSRSQHDVSSIAEGWAPKRDGVSRPSDPKTVTRWWKLPDSEP